MRVFRQSHVLALVVALALPALGQSPVLINEFNYDDSGADDHAFVELYNTTADPVDIGDWVIQVGDYLEGQDPPGVYYQVFIPNFNVTWKPSDNLMVRLQYMQGNRLNSYYSRRGFGF